MPISKPSLRARLLGLAVLPAFAIAAASSGAQAGSLASSVLSISNFRLSSASTGSALQPTDFIAIDGNNTANVAANLSSLAGTPTGAGSQNILDPVTFGEVNLAPVCQGSGCPAFAADDFSPNPGPPPTSHYAHADQRLIGSALDTGGAVQLGADIDTRADVSLTTTDTGSADSNSGADVGFVFTMAASDAVTVSFDYDVSMFAFIDPAVPGNSAQAAVSWVLSLEDELGNLVFELRPGDINRTIAANAVLPNRSFSRSGAITIDTPTLTGGQRFVMAIRHETGADASLIAEVPEPATLALLGSGVFALGLGSLITRRRRKEAAAA